MTSTEIDLLKILLESGFVVKSVFLVLILASILSWSIILKKRKTLSKLRENDEEFQSMFRKSDSLKEIMYKAELMEFSPSREIFIEGYNELIRILEISDKFNVLREGMKVLTDKTSELSKEKIIRSMVGKDLSDNFPERTGNINENVVIDVNNVHTKNIKNIFSR